MDQLKIGKFIADMRKELGLSQKQLADLIGVTDKTISKWETGCRLPDASIWIPLCDSLKIDVNELLKGEIIEKDEYSSVVKDNVVSLLSFKLTNIILFFWDLRYW